MNRTYLKIKQISPFWLYCLLLTYAVSSHAFFWDTVQLASKQAHWFYKNDFQYFSLPEIIDSGHPPFFGLYLACCWKMFGKSLIVSHLSMFPFLLSIVWLLQEIGTYWVNFEKAKYLVLLVLADPFFAGQSVLVSPDIVLVFAFLLSIYGILYQKTACLIIGNCLLALISLRGMVVCFALFLWWVIFSFLKREKMLFGKKMIPFLPAGILAFIFLIYHYQATGWLGYHSNSPWAGSFEKVNLHGFIKNIVVLIWRMMDFGRIFLWGVLLWVMFQKRFLLKRKLGSKPLMLISLFVILFFLLTPSLLIHKGLLGHRYLLPIVLSLSMLLYYIVFKFIQNRKNQKWLFSIAFIGLLSGNCWIYSKTIAQGWDATLAHLPYYHLRAKMIDFIDTQQISYENIGTVFPNIGPFEIYDLNERREGFVRKDFEKNHYLFYSNIFNDFSEKEITELEMRWQKIQVYKCLGIEVVLFKKPNSK